MSKRVSNQGNLRQSDLAAMFNVSRVTISRALRQTGQVETKLEAAILDAARRHGYSEEAQFHARALRQRRDGNHVVTNVICAIIRDSASLGESPFHRLMLKGIEKGVRESGDELLVVPTASDEIRFPRVVIRRQVDGVIWLLSDVDLKYVDSSCFVPMVSLLFTLPGADLVTADDHGAMRAMGGHLARLGHRRVAFLGPNSELAQARLAGLRAGLAGAGGSVSDEDVRMKPYVMLPDTVVPLVREQMARQQSVPAEQRCTAFAVYNDYIAVTVIRCLLEEYGLRVPQDISVTGFDALDTRSAATPILTTAAMPLVDLGAEAVRMISWRMQNPRKPKRRVVLPVLLVEGETVADLR